MDLFSIGSMRGYSKNLRLQTKWNLKKASGNLKEHDDPMKPRKTREASMYQQVIDRQNEESDGQDKLGRIMQKLNAGGKLTKEERIYLKEKAPEVYRQLENAEQDEKDYERELKRCRTKEEARQVKLAHMGAAAAAAKSVGSNPNITEEKRGLLLAVEKRHAEALERISEKFVKRGDYGKLPTEAERAKARREERAEQTESDPEKEKQPESLDREEKTASKGPSAGEKKGASGAATGISTESEERRKVRRAKARAAYASLFTDGEEPSVSMIDVEA